MPAPDYADLHARFQPDYTPVITGGIDYVC